jgi:hypothetical protein
MVFYCAGNFDKYIETIAEFLEFDATQYVCGHLNKIGTRDEMIQAMEFAEDVKKAAAVRISSNCMFSLLPFFVHKDCTNSVLNCH